MNTQLRPGGGFQVLPPIIKNLLIINALVWLAQITVGKQHLVPIEDLFALHYVKSELYKPWQFVTYMFLHDPGNFFHILFNMFALWMFGSTLENLWGSKRFLIFYLICGSWRCTGTYGVPYGMIIIPGSSISRKEGLRKVT